LARMHGTQAQSGQIGRLDKDEVVACRHASQLALPCQRRCRRRPADPPSRWRGRHTRRFPSARRPTAVGVMPAPAACVVMLRSSDGSRWPPLDGCVGHEAPRIRRGARGERLVLRPCPIEFSGAARLFGRTTLLPRRHTVMRRAGVSIARNAARRAMVRVQGGDRALKRWPPPYPQRRTPSRTLRGGHRLDDQGLQRLAVPLHRAGRRPLTLGMTQRTGRRSGPGNAGDVRPGGACYFAMATRPAMSSRAVSRCAGRRLMRRTRDLVRGTQPVGPNAHARCHPPSCAGASDWIALVDTA
jgi:hypothetical protein